MDQSTTRTTLSISRIVGPALTVLILTENPLINPNLYQNQSPTVVYLNGFVLFVGGLTMVQCHNTWCLADISRLIVAGNGKNKSRRWHNSIAATTTTILVTIVGWGLLFLGLSRLIFPVAWAEKSQQAHSMFAGDGATLRSRIQILLSRENVGLLLWEMLLLIVGSFLTYQAYFGSTCGIQEPQPRRENLKEP